VSYQDNDSTDFGYEQVSQKEKTRRVGEVFTSVADKYDVMNDLMSLGIHRLWKRYAIQLSGVKAGNSVLDIAGGTGDLTKKFTQLVGDTGQVILADINASMLGVGKERLIDLGFFNRVQFVQANAEFLPFTNNLFHCITIAFGLRNVTDKQQALNSMYRVMKPGGRLLILEFSKPVLPGLKSIYDLYSFSILPILGKVIANDADSYRYLAESIRMHPDQSTLKKMVLDAGFDECEVINLSGGIVAIHKAIKY